MINLDPASLKKLIKIEKRINRKIDKEILKQDKTASIELFSQQMLIHQQKLKDLYTYELTEDTHDQPRERSTPRA